MLRILGAYLAMERLVNVCGSFTQLGVSKCAPSSCNPGRRAELS